MKNWEKESVKAFWDDYGTKFIRGPFKVNDNVYDFKLIDKSGEDYCTTEQMLSWDTEIDRICSNYQRDIINDKRVQHAK